jgi:hypothetical protein
MGMSIPAVTSTTTTHTIRIGVAPTDSLMVIWLICSIGTPKYVKEAGSRVPCLYRLNNTSEMWLSSGSTKIMSTITIGEIF